VLIAWVFAAGAAVADMPDFYSEGGFNVNRDYPSLDKYETIDPFTGKLQLHHTDIHIKGNGGMDLNISRSYTSQNHVITNGWTMHMGRILNPSDRTYCPDPGLYSTDIHNPTLELPDGSQQVLADAYYSDGVTPVFLTKNLWTGACDAQSVLWITSPEGTKYRMDYQGLNFSMYPTLIQDRNGNTISITYANPNGNGVQITTITTSAGTTLTFNYGPAPDGSGYQVLTSITDGSGSGSHTWSYQYLAESIGIYYLSQVTLPDGTTWKYTYNGDTGTPGAFQISSVTNPMGGTTTYTYGSAMFNADILDGYTGDDVIVSKTASGVGTWNYSYTPSTGIGVPDTTTVTDPLNQTTTYQHFGINSANTIGDVWRIGTLLRKTVGPVSAPLRDENYTYTPSTLSAEGDARSFKWDNKTDGTFNMPMLASTTITQNGATYSTVNSNFDTFGNPGTVTETGPNYGASSTSRTTNYTYNTNCWLPAGKGDWHQVLSKAVTGGVQISRTYDTNCNALSETRDGVTTSYAYDAQGDVASKTYADNRTYNYSGYAHGIPTSENQPESISISRTVDYWGNVLSETNGNGYTTRHTYDGLNRVTSTTYPRGNSLSITYTPTTTTITRGALTETDNYNAFGLRTSVNLGGITQNYTYDALFRRTFTSNPSSTTVGTTVAYDQLNRPTRVTNPDSTTKSTSYGAASKTVTDENGNATTYGYYSYGDPGEEYLKSINLPASVASSNTTITRNGHDQITSVTQNGVTRSYGYNTHFYLTSVVNPETGTTTYGRDAEGNMTSRSVGTSGTTTYGYDLQNRLVGTTYPATPATPSVVMTYSKTNKPLTVTSGGSQPQRSFSYDANDNVTSDSLVVDGYTLTAHYAYNGNDQLSTITYPLWGEVVAFNPDVLGRPTAVGGTSPSGSSSYTTNVVYWPSGQVKQIAYANGASSTYGQDSRLRVNSFATQLGTSTPYLNSTYSYDAASNLSSVSDTSLPALNRTFGYDAINRLTGVSGPWGSGSVTYDGLGNVTSQTYGTLGLSYVYSPTANLLTSVSGSLRTGTYTYDAYGDIATDGTNAYSYDNAPNLVGVNNTATGAAVVGYMYDGTQKRVKTTKNGVVTYEFYDASGSLLAEFTPGAPNKLVENIYLGNRRIAQHVVNY